MMADVPFTLMLVRNVVLHMYIKCREAHEIDTSLHNDGPGEVGLNPGADTFILNNTDIMFCKLLGKKSLSGKDIYYMI